MCEKRKVKICDTPTLIAGKNHYLVERADGFKFWLDDRVLEVLKQITASDLNEVNTPVEPIMAEHEEITALLLELRLIGTDHV